jgi:hypothetical protein
MTSVISWGSYALIVALFVCGYYAVIGLRFFRRGITASIKSTHRDHALHPPVIAGSQADLFNPTVSNATPRQEPVAASADLSPVVHDLVNELGALVQQAAAQKLEKETLLSALSKLLKKYPVLTGSNFQGGITTLIVTEVETHCGIRISAEEQLRLWQ